MLMMSQIVLPVKLYLINPKQCSQFKHFNCDLVIL